MATPTADKTRICKASVGDAPRIATTLGRAFFDDPVLRWTFPDAGRREAALPAFSLFAETLHRHDENYVTSDGTGAALWAPPGQARCPKSTRSSSVCAWRRSRDPTQNAPSPSAT